MEDIRCNIFEINILSILHPIFYLLHLVYYIFLKQSVNIACSIFADCFSRSFVNNSNFFLKFVFQILIDMSTNAAVLPQPAETQESIYVSFDTFYKEYNDKEDGFKYEWNHGFIEKTQSTKQNEIFIILALSRFFEKNILPKTGDFWSVEVEYYAVQKKPLNVLYCRQVKFLKNSCCLFAESQQTIANN